MFPGEGEDFVQHTVRRLLLHADLHSTQIIKNSNTFVRGDTVPPRRHKQRITQFEWPYGWDNRRLRNESIHDADRILIIFVVKVPGKDY